MIYRNDAARLLWRWPHFTDHEMADHESGELAINPEAMDKLEALRVDFARPMVINSGFRTPAHNARISTTGDDGPHTTSEAFDIKVYGAWALELIPLALKHGFTGIGVQQKGPIPSRYLHLDTLTAPAFPRPTIWSY